MAIDVVGQKLALIDTMITQEFKFLTHTEIESEANQRKASSPNAEANPNVRQSF